MVEQHFCKVKVGGSNPLSGSESSPQEAFIVYYFGYCWDGGVDNRTWL